jgi:hypothetical protein
MNGKSEKMNMEIQKKWFIYIGDHHEGPFSAEEISQKLKSGEAKEESYVWCEGMADWQMFSSVNELKNEVSKFSQSEPSVKKVSDDLKIERTASIDRNALGKTSAPKTQKNLRMGLITVMTIVGLTVVSVGTLSALSYTASDEMHASLRPTLIKIVDRFPLLAPIFKLVPSLNDIKAAEQTELEQAQIGLPENGVKLAFALSQNDPNRPYFYISTNLPSPVKLELYIVGNSETLLNRLQFSTQTTVTALHGFGKSDVLSAEGGQPIPKGEYQIYVTEAAEQDEAVKTQIAQFQPIRAQVKSALMIPAGNQFLFVKTYFIGGERDSTYLTRLKAFHEKIKINSEKEVLELRQYSETLQLQFTTLTSEFNRLAKAKKATLVMKNSWKKTSMTWQQINSQLEQTIQTWSKETLENEFFYGKAYALVKTSYESIRGLFALENSYFDSETGVDHTSFDIQYGKALSAARDAVETLRAKVDLIMKAPKSASGLPTREGL